MRSGKGGSIETMTQKEIVIAFVSVVNAQAFDKLDELVAPQFKRHSYASGSPGIKSREDLKIFFRQEFMTFPDAYETIEDIIEEGDKVCARHRFRGAQKGPLGQYPATGRVMESDYITIYRIENGLIAEAWAEWDNLNGLRQLGHLP